MMLSLLLAYALTAQVNPHSVVLSWLEQNPNGITFEVWRRGPIATEKSFHKVAENVQELTWTDTNVEGGQIYIYCVKAFAPLEPVEPGKNPSICSHKLAVNIPSP